MPIRAPNFVPPKKENKNSNTNTASKSKQSKVAKKNRAVSPSNYINYEQQMKNVNHIFILEALHVQDEFGNPDRVELFPYLESFSENYNSNWNSEDVYGRMDGIYNFQNVKRSFTITIRIAAANYQQAKENQYKLSKMIRFLYPAVTKQSHNLGKTESGTDNIFTVNYIRSAPILRFRFGNIICDAAGDSGLYGIIQGGFSINPSHKDGWFGPVDDPVSEKRDASDIDTTFYYKYFDVSFTFNAIHNHILGIDSDDKNSASRFFAEYFPYGLNKQDFKFGSEYNQYGTNKPGFPGVIQNNLEIINEATDRATAFLKMDRENSDKEKEEIDRFIRTFTKETFSVNGKIMSIREKNLLGK